MKTEKSTTKTYIIPLSEIKTAFGIKENILEGNYFNSLDELHLTVYEDEKS